MATSRRQHPVHHGDVPRFDYLPQQREQNCIKVRFTLKQGEWPVTFHVPGVWFRDIRSNTRQWVDARFVKWLIEIPGSPEKRGPMIITEEWRQRSVFSGKLPQLSARDVGFYVSGLTCGIAVTFFTLIASTLFNNATALVATAL